MTYEEAIKERIEHYQNKQQRDGTPPVAVMAYQEVINDFESLLKLGPKDWDPPRLRSVYDDVTMEKVR